MTDIQGVVSKTAVAGEVAELPKVVDQNFQRLVRRSGDWRSRDGQAYEPAREVKAVEGLAVGRKIARSRKPRLYRVIARRRLPLHRDRNRTGGLDRHGPAGWVHGEKAVVAGVVA